MSTATSALDQDVGDAVRDRLDAQVRPFLRLHGGDCELLGVEEGTVRIRFLLACTACKLRPLTLLAAVRPRLLALPGVLDVRAEGVGVSDAAVRRVDEALRHQHERGKPCQQ